MHRPAAWRTTATRARHVSGPSGRRRQRGGRHLDRRREVERTFPGRRRAGALQRRAVEAVQAGDPLVAIRRRRGSVCGLAVEVDLADARRHERVGDRRLRAGGVEADGEAVELDALGRRQRESDSSPCTSRMSLPIACSRAAPAASMSARTFVQLGVGHLLAAASHPGPAPRRGCSAPSRRRACAQATPPTQTMMWRRPRGEHALKSAASGGPAGSAAAGRPGHAADSTRALDGSAPVCVLWGRGRAGVIGIAPQGEADWDGGERRHEVELGVLEYWSR